MKTNIAQLALAMAFAFPTAAHAQSSAGHTHAPASPTASIDVPEAAKAPVEVVDAFGTALAAADFERVEALLDPGVIVLEAGGAERSRSEYMAHHARSDANFLAGAHSQLSHRTAQVNGDTAWIASEHELHISKDGKPLTLRSAETMVLSNRTGAWKIVHIHWSSRPRN